MTGKPSLTTSDSGDIVNFKAWLPNLSFACESGLIFLYRGRQLTIDIGTSCNQAPAFEDLGFAVGDLVTLSTVSHGGPQNATFYNCADIRLVSSDNFTTTANTTCTNTVTTRKTSPTSSDDAEEQAEIDAAAAAAEAKKLTAAEGGGIGAGVTLGVVAMALGGAAYLGYVSFGKKRASKATRIFEDDKSVSRYIRTRDCANGQSMASIQKAPATA